MSRELPVYEHEGEGLPEHMEMWDESAVICALCAYRWWAVRPLVAAIGDLKCPCCGARRTEEVGEINIRAIRH